MPVYIAYYLHRGHVPLEYIPTHAEIIHLDLYDQVDFVPQYMCYEQIVQVKVIFLDADSF